MGCSVSSFAEMLHSHDSDSQKESQYQQMLTRNSFLFSRTIGEGGFGRVSAEIYLGDEKWYALKEIKKTGLLKHKTGLSMLFGELNALKRADHTFIVKLHHAFHDARSCYLSFDLKTGGDLRFFLRHKQAFDERTLAFYMGCLTSALAYLHRRRILHRDVKPENIILDQHGWPHLTDFGVAYVEPSDHPSGLPLSCSLASGTKQYLAPEVFTKGHVHGPEADFWSLGVVLFELMFFRRPFEKHVPVGFINYLELCHQQQANAMSSHSRSGSMCSTATATSPNKSRRLGQTNEHCHAASTAVVSGLNNTSGAFSPAPSPHGSSSRASSRFSPARQCLSGKAPSPAPTSAYFHRPSPVQQKSQHGEFDCCPMPPQSVVSGSFRSCSAARGAAVQAKAQSNANVNGTKDNDNARDHSHVNSLDSSKKLHGFDVDDHELVLINDKFAKVEMGHSSSRGVTPGGSSDGSVSTRVQGISPCSPGAGGYNSNTPTPTPFSPRGGCSINDSVMVAFNHASQVSSSSPSSRRGLLAPLAASSPSRPGSRSTVSHQGSPTAAVNRKGLYSPSANSCSIPPSPCAFPEGVGSPGVADGIASPHHHRYDHGSVSLLVETAGPNAAPASPPASKGRRDSNFTEAKDKFDYEGLVSCDNSTAAPTPTESDSTPVDEPSPTAFLQLPSHLRVPVPMYNALLTKVSIQCVNMIEGLLDLRPACRLGAGRDTQVKNMRNHEWFSLYDWNVNKLEHRALGGVGGGGATAPDPTCDNAPPFNPHFWRKNLGHRVDDNYGGPVLSSIKPSLKEQEEAKEDARLASSSREHHSSLSTETQNLFEGFQYIAPPSISSKPSFSGGSVSTSGGLGAAGAGGSAVKSKNISTGIPGSGLSMGMGMGMGMEVEVW